MNDFDDLLDLPGEEREQDWIRARLKTLSVREAVVLTAASQHRPPECAADAINQLQSLTAYDLITKADGYEALGETYFYETGCPPKSVIPHVNFEQLGRQYEAEYPGLFAGGCYVEFPRQDPDPVYSGGDEPLPTDDQWTIKVRLTSAANPEGVWLRLPSQYRGLEERYYTDDEALALDRLGVKTWNDCALAEAVCVLPQVENLAQEYDGAANLIQDGIRAASILRQARKSTPDFMERCSAALALESCHSLRPALDVCANMSCYDWVPSGGVEDFAGQYLRQQHTSDAMIRSGAIDLKGYGEKLLERKGYVPLDGGYIRRNGQNFQHLFTSRQENELASQLKNDHSLLAALPGTEQEQAWVRDRLETLGVRESIALDAAIWDRRPATAADAVNCLQALDCYEVRPNAGSYEALGRAHLSGDTRTPEDALRFTDLEKVGYQYQRKHPGQFVGNCYVESPTEPVKAVYAGPPAAQR